MRKGIFRDKIFINLNILILLTLILLTLLINTVLYIPYITIAVYFMGTLFYILFIKINSIGYKYNFDYIQSGEASLSLIIIIFILRFFTGNIYFVFLLTFICMVGVGLFFQKILEQKKKEVFMNGLFIHSIAAIMIGYLIYNDKLFDISFISNTIFGYANSIKLSPIHLSILFFIFLVFTIFHLKILPELRLFSNGSHYFITSGLDYKQFNFYTVIYRSFIFSIMILLLGFLGGIGNYMFYNNKNRASEIVSILIIILYTQIMVLSMQLINKYYVIAISITLSYIICIIINKKRIDLYDRN